MALEQGEAKLALAEAQEANPAACSAWAAAKSSKAPAQFASPPPTTTKAKAPLFIEEVCSMEPHPPTPIYPTASTEAGPFCPCPHPQPLFNSSPKVSKASESEDEKVGEVVGLSPEGFIADPFDGF